MATAPIDDNVTRVEYTATAAQTDFTFDWWIKETDHLDVYVNGTLKTEGAGADYTVTGAQSVTGGTVTFNSGLSLNDVVVISLNPDLERQSEFATSGTFRAADLNLELTYLVSCLQYIATQLDRKLGFSDSETGVTTFTLPSPTATTVIGWNGSADGLTNYAFSQFSAAAEADITTAGLANGDILYYSLGDLYYTNTAVLKNIITGTPARGDILYGNASAEIDMLTVGGANYLLTSDGTDVSWGWEVLDEDTMASNSATKLATQQSIKAYVDAQVASAAGSSTYRQLGFGGLELSNGTDTDHDIDIAVGACVSSDNTVMMELTSALTKQIDAAWAVGSAAGGLFTGTVANNTTYHVFLIEKDSDGSIDAGFDTSITAANIPAGYTQYRRIGSIYTDGSANIVQFHQEGQYFYLDTVVQDFQVNSTGTSLVNRAMSVPTGVAMGAIVDINQRTTTTYASATYTLIHDAQTTDSAASASLFSLSTTDVNHATWSGIVRTDSANGWIQTRSSYSAAGIYLNGHTKGWFDYFDD